VLDAFLLRAMSVAGYAPGARRLRALQARRTAPRVLRAGGRHRLPRPAVPAGAASPAPAALVLMVDLLSATGTRPRSPTAHPARGERPGRAHLQWHLERGLRSLPLVERA
jgi:DNA repair protein RecO (recombination protein O)